MSTAIHQVTNSHKPAMSIADDLVEKEYKNLKAQNNTEVEKKFRWLNITVVNTSVSSSVNEYILPIGLVNPLTETGISGFANVLLLTFIVKGPTYAPELAAPVASSISSSINGAHPIFSKSSLSSSLWYSWPDEWLAAANALLCVAVSSSE